MKKRPNAPSYPGKHAGKDAGVILIGVFKLVKGLALLVVAMGMLRLLHRDVETSVTHWIGIFRIDPENRYLHAALEKIFRVTPRQLKELSAGTFLYAALFLTEGVGLLRRKHWAEYLAVVSTAMFIPLEVYELWRRFTGVRLGLLAVNIAIVWYLAARLAKWKR